MKIKGLSLKNIGPFRTAELNFCIKDSTDVAPVTVITGMNGTGKSIVIDSIRTILGGTSLRSVRNIIADPTDFSIELDCEIDKKERKLISKQLSRNQPDTADWEIAKHFSLDTDNAGITDWIVDYWTSNVPTDSFTIQNISAIQHKNVLCGVLEGKKSNVELINFLCHVDYLRNSDIPDEKELGNVVFETMKNVINRCLDNGKFKYIRRSEMMPIVEQNGREVSFDKLSMGNIFLIEHMVMLICKMYSICVLNHKSPQELTQVPGVLLIDEIENHLHPKWQKSVLTIIRETFPKLQIILTTHSPFIVSSAKDARFYVCVSQPGYSEVKDVTDFYENLPVEEILLTEVFNVGPFNDQITKLLAQRKNAYANGDQTTAKEIEKQLIEINPDYFSYLEIPSFKSLQK